MKWYQELGTEQRKMEATMEIYPKNQIKADPTHSNSYIER